MYKQSLIYEFVHRKEGGFCVSETLRAEKYFVAYLDMLEIEKKYAMKKDGEWLNKIEYLVSGCVEIYLQKPHT